MSSGRAPGWVAARSRSSIELVPAQPLDARQREPFATADDQLEAQIAPAAPQHGDAARKHGLGDGRANRERQPERPATDEPDKAGGPRRCHRHELLARSLRATQRAHKGVLGAKPALGKRALGLGFGGGYPVRGGWPGKVRAHGGIRADQTSRRT
jgi:hypothetical protein